jgi:poly(3-hydroxybutyrate) depolymerase
MTMMGGPIDARKSPTAVNNLANERSFEWFENNVIYRVPGNFPGVGRRVYPGFLQHAGFVAMNPDRHAVNHYDYFKNLIKADDISTEAHRKFYDEYNAVLDMDADYYLETIQTVFQEYKLVNGTWDVRSPAGKIERVRPQDITQGALLTIEGELDDISGAGQTRAAHDLCTGLAGKEQRHHEAKGAGHYGIFSGRRWREQVYPLVRSFILEHQKSQAKVPAVTEAPAEKAPAPQKPIAVAKPKAAPTPVSPSRKVAARPKAAEKAVAPAAVVAKTTTPRPARKAAAPVAIPAAAPAKASKAATPAPAKAAQPAEAKAPAPATRWVAPVAVQPTPAAAAPAVSPQGVASVTAAPAPVTPVPAPVKRPSPTKAA